MRTSSTFFAVLLTGMWGGCEPLEPEDDDDAQNPVADAAHDASRPRDAADDPAPGAQSTRDAEMRHEAGNPESPDAGAPTVDSGILDASSTCLVFDASADVYVGWGECPESCTYFDRVADATVQKPDCGWRDARTSDPADPATVHSVECWSLDPASDFAVHLKQTTPWENEFEVEIHQTKPQRADYTFTEVVAGWSGHFFNFYDSTSLLPLKFHMLTRGQPKDSDNLQVYTGESTSDEVFTHPGFECMLQRNR